MPHPRRFPLCWLFLLSLAPSATPLYIARTLSGCASAPGSPPSNGGGGGGAGGGVQQHAITSIDAKRVSARGGDAAPTQHAPHVAAEQRGGRGEPTGDGRAAQREFGTSAVLRDGAEGHWGRRTLGARRKRVGARARGRRGVAQRERSRGGAGGSGGGGSGGAVAKHEAKHAFCSG